MVQNIITSEDRYIQLDTWLRKNRSNRIMLVCGRSISYQEGLMAYFEVLRNRGLGIVRFDDFRPNPLYESVVRGVDLYHREGCDAIIAVGGGSAMDVAKCIKLYSNMDNSKNYLNQTIIPNDIPFLAIPTTAGTGSEATRYAVIYYEGRKQSVTHESCIPDTVLLDSTCLKTLPIYQKKATMMDAFCHAIESFWSVNSTEESRGYSRDAIQRIMANMDGYLENTEEGNYGMLLAAHVAGKAINITQTTAGHAMCYKITSLFQVAHGHAAILCDRVLFPWMIKNTDRCIDVRGGAYLKDVFEQIADAMGCKNAGMAASELSSIFDRLQLDVPSVTPDQYEELKMSVNPIRLKNHPIAMDIEMIDRLYHDILR